jgi:LmbE family N-acetylglucosaminyl deacetylase
VKESRFLTFGLLLLHAALYAGHSGAPSAAEIRLKLEKLKVLGNVLYVAAHPDDENTRLITYLAQEKKLNTGYFSFTRGDGGQNLIGPEIGPLLGVIRTQELIAARRIDGGQQYFSRAIDFGYSKSPEETFAIWNRDSVLADLVWVIRTFRPDVLINRFNTQTGNNHGHHTASAILALEAIDAAADPKRFPEQLRHTSVWKPKAVYWNTYWWSRSGYEQDTARLARYNVGAYNPVLGRSYTEIAAESRSMHKSQGFGASGERGDVFEYLQFEKGENLGKDIFAALDLGWSRVKGGQSTEAGIDRILKNYRDDRPEASVPDLVALRRQVKGISDEYWRRVKLREIDDLLADLTGLFLEVRASHHLACPGEEVEATIEMVNRSAVPVVLQGISWGQEQADTLLQAELGNNRKHQIRIRIRIPDDMNYTQPYWLAQPGSEGLHRVDDPLLIGAPDAGQPVICRFDLRIAGEPLQFDRPLLHRITDPVRGEVYRPFVVSPPLYVHFDKSAYLFPDAGPRSVKVGVRPVRDDLNGRLRLELPAGWRSVPAYRDFSGGRADGEQTFEFTVHPAASHGNMRMRAVVDLEDKSYSRAVQEIDYDHIPPQIVFPEAVAILSKLDLKIAVHEIGYLMGAGDDLPASLEQLGCRVTLINNLPFTAQTLDRFDAIVIGVRAYNTVERLRAQNAQLLAYVERGGTLIVQYNTSHNLVNDAFAPFPITLSRSRVTEEQSPVELLQPDHRLLNYPNRIVQADFEGWVQERGLYFPGRWDERYQAVLGCRDTGEEALAGGILAAPHGKGHYIYTSLSWFRQLPAAIPGSYRLFANLLSIGRGEEP